MGGSGSKNKYLLIFIH